MGTLVPPGHVSALSQALEESIGREVRAEKKSLPSWTDIGAKILSLYDTLLEGGKSRLDKARPGIDFSN